MKTKRIASLLVCTAAYAALTLLERSVGVYGAAFSLCLALLFCRVRPEIAIPSYAVVNGLIHFSIRYLAVVGAGALLGVLYVIVFWKTKRKYSVWVQLFLIAIAQTPAFFLLCSTQRAWITAGVGVLGCLFFHHAFIATAYPVFVRGTRYGLTSGERAYAALVAGAICAGVARFEPFGFKTVYFLWTLGCVVYERSTENSPLYLAAGGGLGAAMATGDPVYALVAAAIALGSGVRRAHPYASGVGALALFTLCAYRFGWGFDWQTLAPVGAGALVGFLPEKIFVKARAGRESYRGRFALRTAANREREEVGGKLGQVADALRKAQRLLEGEKKRKITPRDVAEGVREACCRECGKNASCREKIGDARRYFQKAATRGLETGRVTYVDFDGTFTATCARVPRVIHVTGEYVKACLAEKEKRTGEEQGRDVAAQTLAGTATLLDDLRDAVKKGFAFDVEGEKRIRDELACADVVAGDAAIYDGGEKVTLTVREGDERKPEIVRIVSEAAGRSMYPSERRVGVNGTVCLTYRPAPVFGVLYGEKSEAREKVCGDAKEAVKIADDKVLFVLSDGMGTGKNARAVGMSAIALIETFYKAGFAHKTVFGCVSKLLSLRQKEDFSALDVAVLDTRIGELEFIKQGGRESYFFSSSGVEKLEGGTLPIGIVDECEPRFYRRKVRGDELVVLLSDGIADVLTEADIAEIVGNVRTLNPQVIAEKIVENAVKKAGEDHDDLTAMAIRIVKNAV